MRYFCYLVLKTGDSIVLTLDRYTNQGLERLNSWPELQHPGPGAVRPVHSSF